MPITRRKRANPPEQPEENTNHSVDATENTGETSVVTQTVGSDDAGQDAPQPVSSEPTEQPTQSSPDSEPRLATHVSPPSLISNGERVERQEQPTSIESGRRTARGELFRRAPQGPVQPPHQVVTAPPVAPPPPQPSHEITLPLGNLLHLAYNPGYTGADDARSRLLQKLAQESKEGGRARCWNCGSLAIKYDRWNTRSKTFGEVGVAFCEVCGVWSVM